MTLAFQSMVMLVLLVCGAVAVLPALLMPSAPRVTPALRLGLKQPGLWIVENPKGQWFVNGYPQSSSTLVRLVQSQGRSQMIHYLPSDTLQLQKVMLSLRWLRSLAPGSVVLELPPTTWPSR